MKLLKNEKIWLYAFLIFWVIAYCSIRLYNYSISNKVKEVESSLSYNNTIEFINFKVDRQRNFFYRELPQSTREKFDSDSKYFFDFLKRKLDNDSLDVIWKIISNRTDLSEAFNNAEVVNFESFENFCEYYWVSNDEFQSRKDISFLESKFYFSLINKSDKTFFFEVPIASFGIFYALRFLILGIIFLYNKSKSFGQWLKDKKWYFAVIAVILFITKPNSNDFEEMGHYDAEKKFDALVFNCYDTDDGVYIGILGNAIYWDD